MIIPNKGVLLSRISLTGTNDVTTIPSPAHSLIVYNLSTIDDITPGYYYWSEIAVKWVRILDIVSRLEGWSLIGNEVKETDFIGTTNDMDVVFKRNNIKVGRLTDTDISFGVGSLLNSTGTYLDNIALGRNTLYSNTVGNRNVAISENALFYNINGNANIGIGIQSLYSNTSGNSNIAIGVAALVRNTIGVKNIAIGTNALQQNVSGYWNTAIGELSGPAGPSSNELINTTAIGFRATVRSSNTIRFGNNDILTISGYVGFSQSSDKRFKENIKTIPLGLAFINKIRPVEYVRKNNEFKTKEWGVIAQELEETLEEVNYYGAGIVQEDGSEDKMLSVRYTDLIAPLIKAVQELTVITKELEIKNNVYEERIKVLESKKSFLFKE